jgi:hypothetical protein
LIGVHPRSFRQSRFYTRDLRSFFVSTHAYLHGRNLTFIRKAIQYLALTLLLAAAAGAAYIYGLKPDVARPASITIERIPERLARQVSLQPRRL